MAVQDEIRISFSIDERAMRAFAELSGDRNPFHTDATYARQRGLAGQVVYGGLLLAHLSRLIGMELPTRNGLWTGLKVDFRQVLYVDEPAVLIGRVTDISDATGRMEVDFRIEASGRLIAHGTAEAIVGREP